MKELKPRIHENGIDYILVPKASIQSVNTLRKTGDRFLQKNKSMKPFSGLME